MKMSVFKSYFILPYNKIKERISSLGKNLLEKFSFSPAKNLQKIIQKFNDLEKYPIEWNGELNDRSLALLDEGETYFKTTIDLTGESEQLEQRMIGLKYRLEKDHGGLSREEASKQLLKPLMNEAREWKRNHPLVGESILTSREVIHLKKATEYPEFISLLSRSSALREKFFLWTLRDENDAAPFIEFPNTADKIIENQLSGRISRFGHTFLKIKKIDGKKMLTLPFEGREVNILNLKTEITFRGNYTLSLEEVYAIFKNKEFGVGNLEVMGEGIVNWNGHFHGYWDDQLKAIVSIDFNKKDWWKDLPYFEILNRRQVSNRYGLELKKNEWIAIPTATRGRPNLDFEDTHAFLEIAIPLPNGDYALYEFGKQAIEFPKSLWDKLKMLTRTVHATVAYPDDNVFYTHRQKGFHPFVLSANEGVKLMDTIKNDIFISRANNFIYQIESENCARWVHEKISEVVGADRMPDLFRMSLLDTEPQGPVAFIFNWIKKLPKKWQVPVLTHLHFPLGAARKIWVEENGQRVAKSLSNHSFFKTGEVFLPALLIAKAASYFGNFFKIAGAHIQNLRTYVKFSTYGFVFTERYAAFRLHQGVGPNREGPPIFKFLFYERGEKNVLYC